MSIADYFLPAWKHSNPEVRLDAIQGISQKSIKILEKIAQNDADSRVRIKAIQKIQDRQKLIEIASSQPDKKVKEATWSHILPIYYELLSGTTSIAERKSLVDELAEEEVLSSLILQFDDVELRMHILPKISNPEVLCKIALSNCGSEVGLAIVDRISDSSLLEKIGKRGLNKKIKTQADQKRSEILREQNKKSPEEEQTIALEKVCKTVERVLNSLPDWNKREAILNKAEQSWKKFDPDQNHVLYDRLIKAQTLIQEREGKESREKEEIENKEKQEKETIATFEDLCTQLENLDRFQTEQNLSQEEELKKQWKEAEPQSQILKASTFQILEMRFQNRCDLLEESRQKKNKNKRASDEKQKQLEVIFEQIETLGNSHKWDKIRRDRKDLKNLWKRLLSETKEASPLEERAEKIFVKMEEDLKRQEEKEEAEKQKAAERLKSLYAKMEELLKGENPFSIEPKVKDLQKQWKLIGGASLELKKELSESFEEMAKSFYDQLSQKREDQQWEQWTNLSRKEELCQKVETLYLDGKLAEGIDLLAASKTVQESQEQWRKIGFVAKEKSDEIWERFKKGCAPIYELCLVQKKELYEEIKLISNSTEWKETAEKIKEIQVKWNELGTLPKEFDQGLHSEFQTECNQFFEKRRVNFQKMDEERAENFKKKTALCNQAETLRDSTNWSKTSSEMVRLQKEWKEIGPVPKSEGDELWNRFRNAANHFFDQLEKVKPENLKLKEALCEQVEELVKSVDENTDLEKVGNQLKNFQRQWKEIGPVPKEQSDPIWERFNTPCNEFFNQRKESLKDLEGQYEENQKLKEELVQQAGELADSTRWKETAEKLKQLQVDWKKVGPASPKEDSKLWERFRESCNQFFSRSKKHFEEMEEERLDNLKKKEVLCLKLELLSKVSLENVEVEYNKDVPMAEQLQVAMKIKSEITAQDDPKATWDNAIKMAKQLQMDWKKVGPVPNKNDQSLWQRFRQAGDLFFSNLPTKKRQPREEPKPSEQKEGSSVKLSSPDTTSPDVVNAEAKPAETVEAKPAETAEAKPAETKSNS